MYLNKARPDFNEKKYLSEIACCLTRRCGLAYVLLYCRYFNNYEMKKKTNPTKLNDCLLVEIMCLLLFRLSIIILEINT
jgi:hypothetical protein